MWSSSPEVVICKEKLQTTIASIISFSPRGELAEVSTLALMGSSARVGKGLLQLRSSAVSWMLLSPREEPEVAAWMGEQRRRGRGMTVSELMEFWLGRPPLRLSVWQE